MVIAALPLFIVASHRAHHAKSWMLRMRGDVVVLPTAKLYRLVATTVKGKRQRCFGLLRQDFP
jgi:hypothetical protein